MVDLRLGTSVDVSGRRRRRRRKQQADPNHYVKSYKVQVSTDNSVWYNVDSGKVFTANTADNNVKVENKFEFPVSARYVRIVVQTWNGHLSMRAAVLLSCAVMSAGKPTSQSSTDHGGSAARAVDGNTATNGGSCTHTNKQSNPFWRVDLEQKVTISTVKVVNRGG